MRLTFVLFHYFPYGGLERDMLTMAHACRERGHEVTIYTASWQGPKPVDIGVVELPVRARTNHGRSTAFVERFLEALRNEPPSVIVGFNKMPGLDVYYAADGCFAHKVFAERGFLYRLTPRARHYLKLENAVFGNASNTEVLIIAKAQIPRFQHYYATPPERLHLLAPGIRRDCVMPADYTERRSALRRKYALADDERLILFVGSDYRRKGLDRALRGIAALDEPQRRRVRLWVAGQDKQTPFLNLVRTLGLEQNVRFLGARDDVPQLMWSADLLLHPAYSEAAGLVLLEAMVAGLPVIASAVCGYAHHIEENAMGRVLADPITPPAIAAAIESVFAESSAVWQERGNRTARQADIFSMPQHAAEIIERVGVRKTALNTRAVASAPRNDGPHATGVRLTFVLFHYFPYGGLERDMLTMAQTCRQRGHEVTIYTAAWEGPRPQNIAIVELPVQALTNHGRSIAFVERFIAALRALPPSVVIGFNKMPALDVYYAADVCFAHKVFAERGFLYRLTPRARHYLGLERAVFGSASNTEVLIIAKAQIPLFQHYYATPSARLHLLAPGTRRDCVMPPDYAERRDKLRHKSALAEDERLILFVGSNYRLKGLDRALRGIAALDEPQRRRTRLWIAGQDNQAPFLHLAHTLGLEQNVRFLGARDDVPQLMWSADLLLHPAYSEAAGLVLLEAMVAGLPVIASAACGYAHHIEENSMGVVLQDPITPTAIATAIASVFNEGSAVWQERSRETVRRADIFSMPQRAAEIIERVSARKLGMIA